MPSAEDADTSDTAIHDAAVLAEFARRSREAVQEATGTDEYRAIGAIASIRPKRAS